MTKGVSTAAAPVEQEWVDLVIVDRDPPVPFDDANVLQIMRDYVGWFLPLLGDRRRSDQIFSHDASRCAGTSVSFTADSRDEAEWIGSHNPWRRVGRGWIFSAPSGLFVRTHPQPGPNIQRRD